jgi:D-alanyl-D-alanine carboxypeptidase
MNEKAQELGMTKSHFVNPSGLNADGHYSTARDMAVLAAACLENETVAKICATQSATFGTRTFVNHNRLLSLYDGCVGMKTGYTQRAGRTLVSAARRDGQTLIVVTLNDPDDWNDHMALLDYGFASYPSQELNGAGEVVATIPVQGSLVRSVDVVTAEAFYYPLKEGEQVQTSVEIADQVEAPVLAGQIAGRLVYQLDGQEIGSAELRYGCTVDRNVATEGTLLQRILSAIFGRTVTVFGHGAELIAMQ